MKIFKNSKGFSFLELSVAVIIMSILVVIWGFSGGGDIKRSMLTEAKMFIEQVVGQEKIYLAQKSEFWVSPSTITFSDGLRIGTVQNKYFKTFKISSSSAGSVLTIEVYGSDSHSNKVMVRGIWNSTVASDNKIDFYKFYNVS